jgi:hypothetical protein
MHNDGRIVFRSLVDGTTLTFNDGEWSAFVAGVSAGEFDRAAA